jgi:hypothetical protein
MGQDTKSKRESKSVEILAIINKPKHPKEKKKKEYKEQSERTHSLTSKKTKEPPKRPNHKGNIKFPNPIEFPYPLLPVARSISLNKERAEHFLKEKDMRRIQNKKQGAKGVHKYQTDIHIHNMPNCGHKGFYLCNLSC